MRIHPVNSVDSHDVKLLTEIDAKSFTYASANVDRNERVASRIKVMKTTEEEPILGPLFPNFRESLDLLPDVCKFAFTMCNPPFYGSVEEVLESAEGKADEPNAVRRV